MHTILPFLVGALLVGSGTAALGVVITLSEYSSNGTDPALLSATLDFSVAGSTLTLEITNDTVAPNGYNINELYFNADGGVTGLSVDRFPPGWSLVANSAADNFGTFDFGLIDGVDNHPKTITPGETEIFTFIILGSGVDSDFTTELSTLPPGDTPAIVAGKFVSGPDGNSAYGATPEPAAIGLLLLGALVAINRRRS